MADKTQSMGYPRLIDYRKPIRFSRQALWMGLFGYLILLFALFDENLLPAFSAQSALWWTVIGSIVLAFAGMAWIVGKGIYGVLHQPLIEYGDALKKLPKDTLITMVEHYPEFSELERHVLRQVLSNKHPGWSVEVTENTRSAFS
ncbi:MAG: hypothetical protein AWU57_1508 [Marinobacter sp. T13-3]|mgnify:CR=1 FL=1|nr:MAG: hypothetical protein AWU57_1508 [Marinobacter sp. T13-3]